MNKGVLGICVSGLILCPGRITGSQRCPSVTALLSEAVTDSAGTMALNYCVGTPCVLDFLAVEEEGKPSATHCVFISCWYKGPSSNGKHELILIVGSCSQMLIWYKRVCISVWLEVFIYSSTHANRNSSNRITWENVLLIIYIFTYTHVENKAIQHGALAFSSPTMFKQLKFPKHSFFFLSSYIFVLICFRVVGVR